MQEKRWRLGALPEPSDIEVLVGSLNISHSLALLLAQRQVTDFESAHRFFRPKTSHLHDPFLMKDMDRAVERIERAIGNQENILIYGDYDVDGTTAVALFLDFLRSVYAPEYCTYYIPDRHSEGYGVSQTGVEWAINNGFHLIITLDCGIKSHQMVEYAGRHGVDFIICDHHLPGSSLPNAYAVLDPKRADCNYPFDALSGCGVGFKLMQAIVSRHPELKVEPLDYLDLVAVSIAADIVPLTGENRVLAYYGLQRLREAPRPGLRALMRMGKMQEFTISSVVFRLAPRINSAGRIDHACIAVDLLLAKSDAEAMHWAGLIEGHNVDRKGTDKLITREALRMIEADALLLNAKTTVLYKENWHKGVIGIVASRCIEKYYRPTIILTRRSEDVITGSARSVHGFDVYDALSSCSDLLTQFGGHRYAAGMTMKEEHVPAFQKRFEEVVASTIQADQLIPVVDVDCRLTFNEITGKFYRVLKQMAPFGPENLCPVFLSEHLIATRCRILKGEHLKLTVKQKGSDRQFEAIGFGMAEYMPLIASGAPFSMVYSLTENEYRGYKSLQMEVKDIKPE